MKTLLLFLGICCYTQLTAQEQKIIYATSGSHLGDIMLGMSEKQVRKILPGNYVEASYSQKMKEFKDVYPNLHIDSLLQFILGFDKMLTTSDEMQSSGTPIYNLAFKNDKLNYIGVTTYGTPENVSRSVLLDQQVRFFMSEEETLGLLGNEDFLNVPYAEYTDHIYYKRGLEILHDAGKLTCFTLFTPVQDIRALIAEKRAQLIREFAAIE